MNKLLIVLLAVCLVSVHAFVKRDAPASPATENYLELIQKKFQDFSKDFTSTVSKSLDPEEVKKNFNTFVDSVNKAFKPTPATA